MTRCSVPYCGNKTEDGHKVFHIPIKVELRQKWLDFLRSCNKYVDSYKHYAVCENHFLPDDIVKNSHRSFLRHNVSPSIFNKKEISSTSSGVPIRPLDHLRPSHNRFSTCQCCFIYSQQEMSTVNDHWKRIFKETIGKYELKDGSLCTSCSTALKNFKLFRNMITSRHDKLSTSTSIQKSISQLCSNISAKRRLEASTSVSTSTSVAAPPRIIAVEVDAPFKKTNMTLIRMANNFSLKQISKATIPVAETISEVADFDPLKTELKAEEEEKNAAVIQTFKQEAEEIFETEVYLQDQEDYQESEDYQEPEHDQEPGHDQELENYQEPEHDQEPEVYLEPVEISNFDMTVKDEPMEHEVIEYFQPEPELSFSSKVEGSPHLVALNKTRLLSALRGKWGSRLKPAVVSKPEPRHQKLPLDLAEGSMLCDTCGFHSEDQLVMQRHIKIWHKDQISEKFRCNICKFMFNSKENLIIHHNRKHFGRSKFNCLRCLSSFRSIESLSKHNAHHDKFEEKNETNSNDLQHIAQVHEKKRDYQCESCGSFFMCSFKLRTHKLSKHGDGKRAFNCDHCGLSFVGKKNIIQHLQAVDLPASALKCDYL